MKLTVGVLACALAGCGGAETRAIPLRAPLRAHPATGFPSPQQIMKVLNEPSTGLSNCFEARAAYRITDIWFAIQPDGSVSDIDVRPTSSGTWIEGWGMAGVDPNPARDPKVERCLIDLVASKRFPEPDAITPIDVRAAIHHERALTMALISSYELCEQSSQ